MYNSMIIEELKEKARSSDIASKHAAAIIPNRKNNTRGAPIICESNKYLKNKIIVDGNTYYKTIHAEIKVTTKMPRRYLKNIDIIVIRVSSNGMLKNSRPCNNCIDKLTKLGIRKIYYSTDTGDIISEYVKDMERIHTSHGHKFFDSIIIK